MKIEDYFCIPSKERKQRRYLCILKIIMSFISGIFIILLHKIFDSEQNNQDLIKAEIDFSFSIGILLLLTTLIKSCFYLNFKYKSGEIPKIQPSLECKQVIIPTAIKCFLYMGLTKMAFIYMDSLDGVSIIILNVVFMLYFRIKVSGQNLSLLRQILKTAIISGALILTTRQLQFTHSLTINLFLVTGGTLSMMAFVDLNDKVFEIYKPSVEEFMAKQYITELIIYSIYLFICLLVRNQFSQAVFVLRKFPYVILFVGLAALTQYALLQFLNKKKIGELIFSFLSGIFWAQLYFLKINLLEQQTQMLQQRYLFGFGLFILSIIILTGMLESKNLVRLVQFLLRSERQPQRF